MYNTVYCDEFGIHLNLRGLDKWIDETNERLTKLESYVKPEVIFDVEKMKVLGDEIGIFSGSYVDEKLYNKLEEKHEADLEHVTEDRDKLKSECYIAQENLKITKEKLKETEEKFNDACVLNKMREDVFEANIKLQKTIEAKDREIGLLRAELDKYKTDDECDDRWID